LGNEMRGSFASLQDDDVKAAARCRGRVIEG
jgi:hypothetical protein